MSGREFSFEVNRTSSAPAATLFRLVADGANWSGHAAALGGAVRFFAGRLVQAAERESSG